MDIKAKEGMNAQNPAIRKVAGFTSVLPDEFQAGFEMGDTIVLPKTMGTVYEQRFGTHAAQFMVVEVRHANGAKEAINWFPASMMKAIFPVEVDGSGNVIKTMRPIYHSGTAVDLMKSCRGRGAENGTTDLQMAVNGFLGHEILVEKVDVVPTEKWKDGERTGQSKDTRVYTYSFVAKNAEEK